MEINYLKNLNGGNNIEIKKQFFQLKNVQNDFEFQYDAQGCIISTKLNDTNIILNGNFYITMDKNTLLKIQENNYRIKVFDTWNGNAREIIKNVVDYPNEGYSMEDYWKPIGYKNDMYVDLLSGTGFLNSDIYNGEENANSEPIFSRVGMQAMSGRSFNIEIWFTKKTTRELVDNLINTSEYFLHINGEVNFSLLIEKFRDHVE